MSVVGREFSTAAAAPGVDKDLRLIEDRCAELARRRQSLAAAGTEAWPYRTIAERYRFIHVG